MSNKSIGLSEYIKAQGSFNIKKHDFLKAEREFNQVKHAFCTVQEKFLTDNGWVISTRGCYHKDWVPKYEFISFEEAMSTQLIGV